MVPPSSSLQYGLGSHQGRSLGYSVPFWIWWAGRRKVVIKASWVEGLFSGMWQVRGLSGEERHTEKGPPIDLGDQEGNDVVGTSYVVVGKDSPISCGQGWRILCQRASSWWADEHRTQGNKTDFSLLMLKGTKISSVKGVGGHELIQEN